MTIGIAAYGSGAGRAVLNGVLATEVLGCGSIGGFVVVSFLDDQGLHRQFSGQRGGIAALGAYDGLTEARCAAVISSGPDRPEPLSQFLAGDGMALVTGHRLPQRPGASGKPLNLSALERIRHGQAPQDAVRAELDENAEADCGLIAVTSDGRIGFANSARVRRRADLIEAYRSEHGRGYALLGNSIHFNRPRQTVTAIGDLIWSTLAGNNSGCFLAQLARPVPVSAADEDRIDLDETGDVLRIARADPWWPASPGVVTVVYSRTPVWQGGRQVGTCITEVFARLDGETASPDPSRQTRFAVERS
ncbi:DUF6963 family protein [Seohaeicola nanhaiensis]|uniref:DUF6963 family protein n=1 Tax=Seohaeicola nanhaiensis TaxID=1387282 RepID=A0ABV9KK66_9RHOB